MFVCLARKEKHFLHHLTSADPFAAQDFNFGPFLMKFFIQDRQTLEWNGPYPLWGNYIFCFVEKVKKKKYFKARISNLCFFWAEGIVAEALCYLAGNLSTFVFSTSSKNQTPLSLMAAGATISIIG